MRPDEGYFDGINKRLESVAISGVINKSSLVEFPDRIKAMFTDEHTASVYMPILIMQVVLIIENASLGRKMSCTMREIVNDLNAGGCLQELRLLGCAIDPDVLCSYIVIGVLQNGGIIHTYMGVDASTGKFRRYEFRLITEEAGEYSLTPTALDYLFRQKEVDEVSNYNFYVTQSILCMKNKNYEKAYDETGELLRLVRRMRVRLHSWELKFKENIVEAKVREFTEHCGALFETFEQNYDKLGNLKKMLDAHEKGLRQSFESSSDEALRRETRNNLNYLRGIVDNINDVYNEQNDLLSYHQRLSEDYAKRIEQSLSLESYEHLSFRKDIFEPLCRSEHGIERLFDMIFAPLLEPGIDKVMTLEDLFTAHELVERSEMDDRGAIDLGGPDSAQEDPLLEAAEKRNRDIVAGLLAYANEHGSFCLSEYLSTVQTELLTDWRCNNAIYNIVMQFYYRGRIDVVTMLANVWVDSGYAKGDYDLDRHLQALIPADTSIQSIEVVTSSKICKVERDTELGYRINDIISDFVFEVVFRAEDAQQIEKGDFHD